jgi:hypothetical protein
MATDIGPGVTRLNFAKENDAHWNNGTPCESTCPVGSFVVQNAVDLVGIGVWRQGHARRLSVTAVTSPSRDGLYS